MIVRDLLRRKGTEVHSIGKQVTLDDVVEQLVRYNVGSLCWFCDFLRPRHIEPDTLTGLMLSCSVGQRIKLRR